MYKITLLLVLIPSLVLATIDEKKHEKIKKIKKEFAVNKDAKLTISNKYGNVNISSWDQNKIEIEVVITVKGDDLDRIYDKLEAIQIQFNASSDLVTAKTVFENADNSWFWWKKNDNLNFKIDYFVKMPISNSIDIRNDYGSIFIDSISGDAVINCDYGKIMVGELNGNSNYINLDYCSSSNITFVKNAILDLDYSKLAIEKSEKIKANFDYTTLYINSLRDLNYHASYGSLKIENAEMVAGNSDYTGLSFGTISKKLHVETGYGSVFVKELKENFESVNIDGQYTSIKIEVSPNAVFEVILDLQYANFNENNDKFEFYTKIDKSTKKYFEGKFGKGNTNSKIKIKSQYGGVSIK